jgi:hypothetical protein
MTATTLYEEIDSSGEGLRRLVGVQKQFDEIAWEVGGSSFAKFRHIVLHLLQSTATLGKLVERCEHHELVEPNSDSAVAAMLQSDGIVIGKLMMAVLQLANLAEVDIADMLHQLYEHHLNAQ